MYKLEGCQYTCDNCGRKEFNSGSNMPMGWYHTRREGSGDITVCSSECVNSSDVGYRIQKDIGRIDRNIRIKNDERGYFRYKFFSHNRFGVVSWYISERFNPGLWDQVAEYFTHE